MSARANSIAGVLAKLSLLISNHSDLAVYEERVRKLTREGVNPIEFSILLDLARITMGEASDPAEALAA